ncbi:hypothetical protein OSB04_009102 [Centaurea solstitialis]|uniref:Nucleotide exchange factor Fes1 domain-containing protein n=1 Tax=Centaurea solstitialis TaxID=347529 RepID=A0AA38WK22_9ASTR|nr:hypothetical protein OSB04_009102 [Centaurea solstitialis]
MRSLLTFFALMLVVVVEISRAEPVNNSASSGLLWSTTATETDDESLDELDGGFPSLDGMLQWAIGHSDPAKLELKAHDVQQLSTDELQKRQMEIKELVEKLEMPSDAKLMRTAIDDLSNSSLSLEDRHHALEELLILVEAIDNANDLHKIGGLSLVVGELSNSDPGIRKTCAWIVGKASQNNPVVQKQALDLGALPKLMMMVKSSFIEEAIKALYAVSAIIRNNPDGLKLFYSGGGDIMIQGILSSTTADVRLQRRSVSLVADLAEYQLQHSSKAELPFFSNCALVRPMIDLTASADLDLFEKVLLSVKNLLMLKSSEHLVVDGFCGLDGALERMGQQLKQLTLEESHREYAIDVEGLCKEVNLIYLQKLNEIDRYYLARMKKGTAFFLKNIISLLSFTKSKSLAIKSKVEAIKAKVIIFSLLKNKKLSLTSRSISHKIHALLLGGSLTQVEEDDIVQQQATINGDDDDDDDDDKYPDLRHSLFDQEDDMSASAIDLVKNSMGEENFSLEDEIDHVADLFIMKFHKRMRLQKLESFKRYQDMLDRSS